MLLRRLALCIGAIHIGLFGLLLKRDGGQCPHPHRSLGRLSDRLLCDERLRKRRNAAIHDSLSCESWGHGLARAMVGGEGTRTKLRVARSEGGYRSSLRRSPHPGEDDPKPTRSVIPIPAKLAPRNNTNPQKIVGTPFLGVFGEVGLPRTFDLKRTYRGE